MVATKKSPSTRKRATKARTSTRSKVVAQAAPAVETIEPKQASSMNQTNKFLVILVVLLIVFSGYLFKEVNNIKNGAAAVGNINNTTPPEAPTEVKAPEPNENDHRQGAQNARFVMIEYSDLECPYCKQGHDTYQRILDENEGEVAWIYRHFPLSFHPKAQKSGEAIECAAELGGPDAFWSMTDAIFDKMPTIEVADLSQVAGELGIDPTAMQTCLDSNKYEQVVKDGQAEGAQAGVRATPTVVIFDTETGDTRTVEGALPYDAFKTELDAIMNKS